MLHPFSKNMKSTYLVAMVITFLLCTSCHESSIVIPKEFVESVPPKIHSDEWHHLNYSHNDFSVSINNGSLVVKKEVYGNGCEFKLPNGRLVGIDKGEWGGSLSYKPDDSTQKTIEIQSGNIKFIFSFQGKIYFLEGSSHMGMRRGALYEIDTTNSIFTTNMVVNFHDAPDAYAIYEDKILIATSENFFVVKNRNHELVFKKAFWSCLYPNSIAVLDEKNVFMGIRGGIVKLDIPAKTMKFYKYIPSTNK